MLRMLGSAVVLLASVVAGISAAAAQNLRGELVQSTFHATSGFNHEVRGDFSRDRRFFLTGSRDRMAKLWDVASGRKIRQFGPHAGPVSAVAFAPSGKLIATGSDGVKQFIRIWDVESGRMLKELEGYRASKLAFLEDGVLAAMGYYEVVLINVATGKEVRRLKLDNEKEFMDSWALSEDQSRLAVRARKGVWKHWEVKSGRELARGPTADDEQLALLGDGPVLVASDKNGSIIVKRAAGGQQIARIASNAWRFRVSPNVGFIVAPGEESTTLIWDGSGRQLGKIVHKGGFELVDAVFSPGGDLLAAKDPEQNWFIIDLTGGRIVSTLGATSSPLKSFAILPAGTKALTTDGRAFKLWDLETGRQLRSDAFEMAGSAAVSSDGGFAVIASSQYAKIVDLASGKVLSILGGDQTEGPKAVALSRDSKLAYVADWSGVVRQYDLKALAGPDHAFLKPTKRILKSPGTDYISVSPQGDKLITGERTRESLTVWDVATGLQLASLEGAMGRAIFAADGASMLAGGVSRASLLDARTGQTIRSFEKHDYYVTAVALSPDGRDVLTGSADSFAKIWDKANGQQKAVLQGHEGWLIGAGYLKNGNVATAGDDGTIRLWNSRTGALLATMIGFIDGSWMTVTPEGFFESSSPEAARNLSIVRGIEISSVDQVYNALYRPDLVREKIAGDVNGKVRDAAARLDLTKVAASGSAPRVGIASPASGAAVQGDQATLEADITDQGGGIGKVEWRVNGVTLGVEERGVRRTDQGSAKSIKVSRTLGLTPGDNRIAVLAYNEAGLIASEPVEIVVTSVQQGATRPRLYVLTVGVNDYWDSALKLSYAAPDAKKIADGLKQAGGKLYEKVEVRTVLDGEATAEKLDGIFTELGKKVRPQDVFVFFLAGHGKTVDARFYFLPQDFRYAGEDSITKKGVGQNQLQEWVSRIKAQKSVLLFDACESGSLVGDRIAMRGIEEKTAIDRMTRAMGRTVLTATTDSKPAIEGYRGHGVFTYTLLAGFEAADANADGVVDVTELATYVDRRLPDLTYAAFKLRQVPQMSIVGSNFPLASKVALLPADGASSTAPPAAAAAIPARPTHVVITPADVYEQIAGKGSKLAQLPIGTLVSLVKTEQGWVLVARDGKAIGYVAENQIAQTQ